MGTRLLVHPARLIGEAEDSVFSTDEFDVAFLNGAAKISTGRSIVTIADWNWDGVDELSFAPEAAVVILRGQDRTTLFVGQKQAPKRLAGPPSVKRTIDHASAAARREDNFLTALKRSVKPDLFGIGEWLIGEIRK